MSFTAVRACLAVLSVCTLSLACAPAPHRANLASAPATQPAGAVIRVDCQVLEEGKVISKPSILVESGQNASVEVGNGVKLLGHDIPDGVQANLTPTWTAEGITINGEMLVSRRDDAASAGGSDGTWILQRGHRWVFEIRSNDPDRWYTTPRSVDGYSLRLRARVNAR